MEKISQNLVGAGFEVDPNSLPGIHHKCNPGFVRFSPSFLPLRLLQRRGKFPIDIRRFFGKSPHAGFTILEILAAMFIFAIVVSLIFGSFDSVFSSAERVNAGSDLFEMGNACMMRIRNDLQAAHVMLYPRYQPPDFDDDTPDLYRWVGNEETIGGETFAKLRFTSLAHLGVRQGVTDGIAEIVYYADQEEDNQVVLRRTDNLFPYPEFEARPTDPVMCEHVRLFKLIYYDHSGQEFQEWDSQDDDFEYSTPQTVGVQLVLGSGDMAFEFSTEIVLPMMRYQSVKR